MMKLFYLLIVSFALYTSCKNADEKPATPETARVDSVETEKVDTLVTAETIQFFNQSGFSGFAKARAEGFDWNNFKLVNVYKEDSMLTSSFQPGPEFYRSYRSFIKYSPDSTKFVDLDSYNIEISRNNQGTYTGNEMGPDTEVSLVDLEKGEKSRLVFLGPSGSIEDGGWLDNETIVLVGIQDNASADAKTAVLWKYHLPTKTFFLYELQDGANTEKILNQWRKERLKNVKIR